jgi:acyl transferase domain-containing protein/phosphopantetheinyl transferase
VVLAAESRDDLVRRAQRLAGWCEANVDARLLDVAFSAAAGAADGPPLRLGVVASSLGDLSVKLRESAARLERGDVRISDRSGIYFFAEPLAPSGRVAYVFPGEGAQYPGMLADLCVHFPEVRSSFDLLDRALAAEEGGSLPSTIIFPREGSAAPDDRLWRMDGAVESVLAANLGLLALVRRLGLRPDAVVGHSTGEYSALIAAGAVAVESDDALATHLREGNRLSKQLVARGAVSSGALVAAGPVDPDLVQTTLSAFDGSVWLALDNCPHQVVLFAGADAVRELTDELRRRGVICRELPFGRAYHTPLFAPVRAELEPFIERLRIRRPKVELYSCASAAPYPAEPDEIRTLLLDQWVRPVRFRETVEQMYAAGVRIFVEVGPRGSLSAFVDDTLRRRPHAAVPANSIQRSGVSQLNHLVARLAAHGVALDLAPLYERRRPQHVAFDEPAGGAAPPRAAPALALSLPVIEVRPRPAPAQSSAPPAGETVPAAAPPSDRTAVVQEHLRTMERFLRTQQVVTERFLRREGSTPPGSDAVVLRMTFDLREDRFLRDHALAARVSDEDPELLGLVVVPLTISVDRLVRVAAALVPELEVVAVRDLRAHHWIPLQDGVAEVEAAARLVPGSDREIRASLTRIAGASAGPAVEGTVVFGRRSAPPPATSLELANARRSRWTPERLYAEGMFHGPAFRGVVSVERVGDEGIEATLRVPDEEGVIAGPGRLQTSPLLADAAGQLVGYWTADTLPRGFVVFPYLVRSADYFGPPPAPGESLTGRARVSVEGEHRTSAEIEVVDLEGACRIRLTGWADKRIDMPEAFYRLRIDPAREQLSGDWPALSSALGVVGATCRRLDVEEAFFGSDGGIWIDVLAHIVLSRRERASWTSSGQSQQRRLQWLLGRVAAKDAVRELVRRRLDRHVRPADVGIANDAAGRPFVTGGWTDRLEAPPVVSITHTGGVAVAIAAEAHAADGVGVDVERLSGAPAELEGFLDDGERDVAIAAGRPLDDEGLLRLWCAKEAAGKALGSGLAGRPSGLVVRAVDGPSGAVRIEPAPSFAAASGGRPVDVWTIRDGDLVAAVASMERATGRTAERKGTW